MNFQSKLVFLQAKTYLKTDPIPTWVHHPVTLAQVKDLSKNIMLDWELHAVLSDKTCIQNIVECPHCTCSDIKDNHHFLLVCNQYTEIRWALIINAVSNICQLNVNVLLCGNISLYFDQNKQILKAVQKFLINSQ